MNTADFEIYTCAVLLVAAGLYIRLLVGRRRFYRRGPAGLQYFSSYSRAVIIRFVEAVLNAVGLLMILAGVCLILIVYFN